MRHLFRGLVLVLLAEVLVRSGAGGTVPASAGAPTTIMAYHAGSLADQMRAGQIAPDVYVSADAEVMYTLIGVENNDRARWFLTMAGQKMVIAYSPTSRFKADLDAAAAGTRAWTDVIREPGFTLERGDPRGDPCGYRCVSLQRLAETYYDLPGFADAVMQGDDNRAQILGSFADLNTGKADAFITYLTAALQAKLPYIEPVDEINQSNPALADFYSQVSYTNPAGLTFHGTPSLSGVTIPVAANNQQGAVAFVRYLLSDAGQSALFAKRFLPAQILVGGDPSAVPAGLRDLIQDTYPH